MTTRTINEVMVAGYAVGFTSETQLLAIVGIGIAESSLNDHARNWHHEFGFRPATDVIDVDGGDAQWNMPARTQQYHSDRGLWQISSHFHSVYTDPTCDDLNLSASAIWTLSSSGTDFTPWDTYVSGDAQAHYDVAFDGWPAIRPLVQAFLASGATSPAAGRGTANASAHNAGTSATAPVIGGTSGGAGITRTFDMAYYGGTASADSGAGTNFDVVLGGRPYMIDWAPVDSSMSFRQQTLPLLQRYYLTQEQGNIGEQSLNPADYWRRSSDDWHSGSGQKYNDRTNSERNQYRTSSGIDPWTIGELSLLPATVQLAASLTAPLLAVAGDWLYSLDNDDLAFATDLSGTFTSVTPDGSDGALSGAVSLASDGFMVLVADQTRVHYTTRGDASFFPYHTADVVRTLVRMCKGRVFTAAANVLYTSTGTAGAAVETVLFTHPNSDFTWVDVAPGPSAIYFAGRSGDKSLIYSTQVVSDGTALNVPAVAAELPDGEQVEAIASYLGVLLIGTRLGVRIAEMDASGNLTVGGLGPTSTAVAAFEPQDRFVWYGGEQGGLDRLDLSNFNGAVPAYASDLTADAAGDVLSVVTYADVRVFSVSGAGIYAQDPDGNLVEQGTLYQGWWNYNLPDNKQAVKLVLQYAGNGGQIVVSTAADFKTTYNQAGAVISSSAEGATTTLVTNSTNGIVHEVKLTLARSPLDHTLGPKVTRYTLMSNPRPQRRVTITVPLLLHKDLMSWTGSAVTFDPRLERSQIDVWCQSNSIITYQDAASTYAVTIDDYDWLAYNETGTERTLAGTLAVKLKVVN